MRFVTRTAALLALSLVLGACLGAGVGVAGAAPNCRPWYCYVAGPASYAGCVAATTGKDMVHGADQTVQTGQNVVGGAAETAELAAKVTGKGADGIGWLNDRFDEQERKGWPVIPRPPRWVWQADGSMCSTTANGKAVCVAPTAPATTSTTAGVELGPATYCVRAADGTVAYCLERTS